MTERDDAEISAAKFWRRLNVLSKNQEATSDDFEELCYDFEDVRWMIQEQIEGEPELATFYASVMRACKERDA